MSRLGSGLMALGFLFLLAGLGLALATQDRYAGVALALLGGFLLFLPLTRPHVDE